MIIALVVIAFVVLALGASVFIKLEKERRANEDEARRLAQMMSREVKREAEHKASTAVDRAVRELENATNEDLERIARNLVRGKRVP